MNEFMDMHLGETCIVIGNGLSLKDVPIEFLEKYLTFGSNRIYLLDDFEPTYYVAVNPLVVEQSLDEINAMNCTKFICEDWAKKISGSYALHSIPTPTFSYNPRAYIYEGYTVTYVSLQLAFYMGFVTVLLVGVDHRYEYSGQPNQECTAEGVDLNHFHPEYFSGGTRWHNPDLENSRIAYLMAETAYSEHRRRIVNLTHLSALDVFEKGSLKQWA